MHLIDVDSEREATSGEDTRFCEASTMARHTPATADQQHPWHRVSTHTLLSTSTTTSVTRPIPSAMPIPSTVDMRYQDTRADARAARGGHPSAWVANGLATTTPSQHHKPASANCHTVSYHNFGNGLHLCDTSMTKADTASLWRPALCTDTDHAMDYVDEGLLRQLINDFGLQQQGKDLPDLGPAPLVLDSLPWRSAVQLMV